MERLFTALVAAMAAVGLLFGTLAAQSGGYSPPASPRSTIELAAPWRFTSSGPADAAAAAVDYDDSAWSEVRIPHTWNSRVNRTQHAQAWYRTRVELPAEAAGRRVYLVFDGVGAVATVYLNGQLLGAHRGAYTRFVVEATAAAVFGGPNLLAVQVSNQAIQTADLLPSGTGNQLYTVYGGIYRPARLLLTGAEQIDPNHYGSSGVYVHQSQVSAASAELAVETRLHNAGAAPANFAVRNILVGADGLVAAELQGTVEVAGGATSAISLTGTIVSPRLWSRADPHLYTVYTELRVGGELRDLVVERTGLRFFQLSPSGFTLNGVALPLRGVGKHQETEASAAAVGRAELLDEWATLDDLGVTFVRLAHYPHAQLEYDQADERGIVVWAENGHSNSAAGTSTGDTITREMVYQNFNHPSIIFWSAGNEAGGTPAGLAAVSRYAQVIKDADPSRPTVYAEFRDLDRPAAVDFLFRNFYQGWYWAGPAWTFAPKATTAHYVSEAGAGGVISAHQPYTATTYTINSYEPEEYQQLVLEEHFQVVFRLHPDAIPAFAVWNFRDFADRKYKDTNTKGLLTYGGHKKDSYYLYKAFLRPDTPVLRVVGRDYFLRRATDAVKVYANAPAVTLTVNGVSLGARPNGAYTAESSAVDNVFLWEGALRPGRNLVVADDGRGNSDTIVVIYAPSSGGFPPPEPDGPFAELGEGALVYIDRPVAAQTPFYWRNDLQRTAPSADNSFAELPPEVEGAGWIVTMRQSEYSTLHSLRLGLRPTWRATLYLMISTGGGAPPAWVGQAGFSDTGRRGLWRDDSLNLVEYALYRRDLAAGEGLRLLGSRQDFVVLVKPERLPEVPTATALPSSVPTSTPSPTRTASPEAPATPTATSVAASEKLRFRCFLPLVVP